MIVCRYPRLGLPVVARITASRRSFCTTSAPEEATEKPWKKAEPLSLNQALYLTSEMGIYTTREMQLRVMKSPSFSTDTNAPFVLEDFFNSMDEGFKKQEEDFEVLHVADETEGMLGEEEEEVDEEKVDTVNPVIHNKLVRAFASDPRDTRSFMYNGAEWKERAEGRGLRKRATAHVR